MGEIPESGDRGHNNRPLLEGFQAPENDVEVIDGQPIIPALKHVLSELLNIDPKQLSQAISRFVQLSDGPRSIVTDRQEISEGPYKAHIRTSLRLSEIDVLRVSLTLLDDTVFHLTVKPTIQGEQLTLDGTKPELQQLAYEEIVNAAALMGLVIPPVS
jgi:hypothetical protein